MRASCVGWWVCVALAGALVHGTALASTPNSTNSPDVAASPDGVGVSVDAATATASQVRAQQVAIEQAHEARLRGCWQRFAVNDCLRDARRSRKAALAPWRAQELRLNAQARAQALAEREQRVQPVATPPAPPAVQP